MTDSKLRGMRYKGPYRDAIELVLDQCAALELSDTFAKTTTGGIEFVGPKGELISVSLDGNSYSMIEQILQGLAFEYQSLPLLTTGESKEIRLLTPKITLAKLLPSAYSFTNNRYGVVPGTELVRALFSAELFRAMARRPGPRHLATAFLGLVTCPAGPLLAEHLVRPGNLEVRVKRYHIGSPLHRYHHTERYETARHGSPLRRWSRFEKPLV